MDTRQEITQHIPALRARARRLCRDEAESEDLVQETLLRALRFEAKFGSGTNLRAWLCTVLRNLFISSRRRESTRFRALAQLELADHSCLSSGPPSPDDAFLTEGVLSAFERLPQSFARVVQLVDLEDHAYKEAATELDVPVGTVMSRLSRGRRLLAETLSA